MRPVRKQKSGSSAQLYRNLDLDLFRLITSSPESSVWFRHRHFNRCIFRAETSKAQLLPTLSPLNVYTTLDVLATKSQTPSLSGSVFILLNFLSKSKSLASVIS